MNSKDNSLEVVEIKLLLTTTQINEIYKGMCATKASASAFISESMDSKLFTHPMFAELLDMPDLPDELREHVMEAANEAHLAAVAKATAAAKAATNVLTQLDMQMRAYDMPIPTFNFDSCIQQHNQEMAELAAHRNNRGSEL